MGKKMRSICIPLLNRVPGFRAFTLLEAGDNNVTFISTFNKFADAKASARLTNDWHTEHLNVFIQGYTRIAAGQVRVQQTWGMTEQYLIKR